MTKIAQVLLALKTPCTRAQITARLGRRLDAELSQLEKYGAVKRFVHDRGSERMKQQRRYVTMFIATGKNYITNRTRVINESMR